ncbi:hypothetical protein Moror_17020 [Moniliophthora roreri MCA 2997]|uniref:F-box domain-containing protein n=2 Tax=Moniliophthora roreri TaxID=221103 RepID=V2WUF1_MONRO|nr:hypothetical protein Moror_17020 [Moniliophthora roreri MCA 2997]KAI3608853.1 hypothetical protein WG66_003852 [Moniliophthora roreri]
MPMIRELLAYSVVSVSLIWCYRRLKELLGRMTQDAEAETAEYVGERSPGGMLSAPQNPALSRFHSTHSSPSTAQPPQVSSIRPFRGGQATQIDVEEERNTVGASSSFYLRVRLMLEKAHIFEQLPPVASTSRPTTTFRIFRHRDHRSEPNHFRLLISRSFIRGTIRHGYEFEEENVMKLVQPSQFGRTRIRIPSVSQVMKDAVAPLSMDEQHGPVEVLSESVLRCEEYDDWPGSQYFTANLEAFSAWELSENPHVDDIESLCPPDGWQAKLGNKQLPYPVLRHFWFEGFSSDFQLDPKFVAHLPFQQLVHVSLHNIMISFDDCLKLISNCPDLHTLSLHGKIGEGQVVDGLFGQSHKVPLVSKLHTRMTRLEIHGCEVNVLPFLTRLQFSLVSANILVLDIPVLGARRLDATGISDWLLEQAISELWFPLALQTHPTIVPIVQYPEVRETIRWL